MALKLPEHNKLKGCPTQVVGNFITWLEENDYGICQPDADMDNELFEVSRSTENWLALYFEIDREKLEDEKSRILQQHRKYYP